MGRLPLLAALACLAAPALAADQVSPSTALPLAALVGAHDPGLTPAERRPLKTLADGGKPAAHGAKITVVADAIPCRASNVAIAERSCVLTFGSRKFTILGLRAHELAATLAEAGAQSEGAAGTIFIGVSRLRCTVSPAEVQQKAGGGAGCGFSAAQ